MLASTICSNINNPHDNSHDAKIEHESIILIYCFQLQNNIMCMYTLMKSNQNVILTIKIFKKKITLGFIWQLILVLVVYINIESNVGLRLRNSSGLGPAHPLELDYTNPRGVCPISPTGPSPTIILN